MEDFNSYSKNHQTPDNLADMVKKLSSEFDGKSQNELIMAIYNEAKKGKRQGTLSNQEIDNFALMLSPMLDDKQRKILKKVVAELKKI